MSSVRTVTLELLRHGSDHNQLLSPLTAYLALSGNHDAETVHFEIEHLRLLRRLSDLRYRDGKSLDDGRLAEAASEVGRALGSIRSLRAEIAAARGDKRLVHLRLVLSASELALLPFELMSAPEGYPGQGQWLSLQTVMPLVITREVRRVAPASIPWPDRPRILVAAASPPGVAEVPLRQLLLSIRQALAPWITGAAQLAQHLTVLPNASLPAIHQACRGVPFTHVHILAHGLRVASSSEEGASTYGLALHKDGDPRAQDLVQGERLAAALRGHRDGREGALAGPAVVTLASCDSGNVGSVITPGASIAHHLHEAGIPLVVASQFPLSFRGAAVLAQTLYGGLFWGDDPRPLVHKLRQELYVRCPDTHDWASVAVYAAFPATIDDELQRTSLQRRRMAVDAAMARFDLIPRAPDAKERESAELEADEALTKAMDRLQATVPDDASGELLRHRRESLGRLAGAEKRYAQLLHTRALSLAERSPESAWTKMLAARRTLAVARERYLEVFRLDMSASWALVQHLALDMALGGRLDVDAWATARGVASLALKHGSDQLIDWAHGSLNELAVLAQVLPEGHAARKSAAEDARRSLQNLLSRVGPRSQDAYSVRQQLSRYADWWWGSSPALRALPASLVSELDAHGVPSSWDWT